MLSKTSKPLMSNVLGSSTRIYPLATPEPPPQSEFETVIRTSSTPLRPIILSSTSKAMFFAS